MKTITANGHTIEIKHPFKVLSKGHRTPTLLK